MTRRSQIFLKWSWLASRWWKYFGKYDEFDVLMNYWWFKSQRRANYRQTNLGTNKISVNETSQPLLAQSPDQACRLTFKPPRSFSSPRALDELSRFYSHLERSALSLPNLLQSLRPPRCSHPFCSRIETVQCFKLAEPSDPMTHVADHRAASSRMEAVRFRMLASNPGPIVGTLFTLQDSSISELDESFD